jgi:peptide/nickel transport system permease protein
VLKGGGAQIWLDGTIEFLNGPATTGQRFLVDLDPVFLSFIVFSWMPYARLMNSAVQAAHRAEYIQAAIALGAGHRWVLLRHLIPNTISPALALAARDIGYVILMQTSFVFIGLGAHSEWGQMLALGRNWVIAPGGKLLTYWWVFVPASLFVVLFGVGWNLLGDGLNERVSRAE